MIFLDLVGGGGSEKLVLDFCISGCFTLKVRLRFGVGALSMGELGETG